MLIKSKYLSVNVINKYKIILSIVVKYIIWEYFYITY